MNETLAAGTSMVSVTDANGCSVNAVVTIGLDCTEPLMTTQVTATDCGLSGLTLDYAITCDTLPNVSIYHWKFVNLAAGVDADHYTAGINPHFILANVDGLGYGYPFEVSVRALIGETWTPFGASCVIATQADIPLTTLTEEWCGDTGLESGDVVSCEYIAGATEYEWIFTAKFSTETVFKSKI